MNAEHAQKLARRFIELPQEKRRLFLDGLREEGVDFPLLPIPAEVAAADRDGLSYAQRRMWFLWQLDPQGAAYNLPMAVRLHGELDRAALQGAFDVLVARHETLRTRFVQEGDEVRQQVLAPAAVAIGLEDLTALSSAEREQQVATQAEAQAQAPFDLAAGPLLRVRLLRLAEREHVLLLTLHHIVADGWSLNLLIDEFLRLYDAACAGADATLSTLPIQYRDYALWQRSWLEAGEQERQLAYWRDKLGDEHTPLELPIDHPRSAVTSQRGARHDFQIEARLADQLRALARRHNVTLFMVLLAAFKLLLQRYSGQSAIRVGVPIANRHRAEVEGLIGCFINTQVLHTEIDPLIDVDELLRRVRETALGAQAHQDLPFEQLVEALDLDRTTGQSPLFQVLFNHQPNVADVGELTTRSGLTLERVESTRHTARFDLALDTYESAGRLHAAFTYALDLFDGATIASLEQHWLRLLESIAEEGAAVVGELPLAQALETEPVAYSLEEGDCVHHLIERAANQHPQRVAATSGDDNISYARLNERADELARVLLEAGVLPDQRVGVVGDRSIDMLVGILGTLKAGAAYLPLEPDQPQERLAFMLADGGVHLVLGRSSWEGALPDGVRLLCLDQPLPPVSHGSGLPVDLSRANLAYVIYTSGTTGTPKGVAVSHGALANYIEGISRRLPLDAIQSMAMVSTPAADLGHTVLYGSLCAGKTLHLLDKETVLDAEAFATRMAAHEVDALKIVPSHLDAMLSAGSQALPRCCLILGGEACSPALLDRIAALAPELTVLNHYGPTETTVGVLSGELTGLPVLGSPLENSGAQVLDACLQAIPGSARGELYISGAGLARGYLGRPALTAERFVPDPAGTPGGRMYRTGDWVRRSGEGGLLFAGRMDGQVKIRGYRVELAEIESRLRALSGIGNALLRVVGEEYARQLVAYLLPATALDGQAQQVFLDEVRAALKRALPEHMVPAYLLVLDHLPVTANGKVDLKALPEPVAVSEAYVAPNTPLQMQLAEIWAEVLRVERVGLMDNFFSLGGDSIMTIQVVTRARRMGIQLSPRDLFQYQTIHELAAVAKRESGLFIDQGSVTGETPLTPIQYRFLEMEIPERHHWNQSVLLTPTRTLDAQVLEYSLRALVTHHDALRLSFSQATPQGWTAWYRSLAEQQQIWDEGKLVWHVTLNSPDELQFVMDKAQRSLDLERGSLLRAVLADLPNEEQRLLVVIHHLVVDGVSWRVLLEDLQQVYEASLTGRNVELPAKTSSFKAWAESLSGLVSSGALNQDLDYWKRQLASLDDALPSDYPEGGCQQKHAAYVSTHLDREQTRLLLKEAPLAYRTQVNDLLLTALARLICRWSGRAEVFLRLEGHGREDLFDNIDTTRTVGWFTSLFPARLKPQETLAGSIKAIKEQLRAIPNKGMGYGLLRYLGSPDIRQVFEQLPQGEIVFNYLGQFDQSFATKDALFKHSGAHSGSAHCEDGPLGSLLSINGHVYDEELELTWTYSREKFDESTIQHLADAYAKELEELIEHCCDGHSCAVTPSDFPLAELSQEQLDNLPIPPSEIIDVYPLSPMQQGMLFHTLYNQNGGEYINQMRVDVEGLDVERFRQAWQSSLDTHEVLRSIFVWQGDLERPVQVVCRQVELPFAEYDWRGQSNSQEALGTLAEGERRQGFDLTYAPLLRLAVVRVTEDTYHLIYTSHHILMDGWSSSRLFGEVLQRYSGRAVAPFVGRYRDYISWLEQQDLAASESFWRGQLVALEEPTRLVQAIRCNTGSEQGYGDYFQDFDAEQTGRLKRFAQRHKVTVNTLMQAAWLLLLQRYTGQEAVCLGVTVAGRPTELVGAEEQVGLFINTLPFIGVPRPEQSVAEWIQQVQTRSLMLMAFEHTPLYEIQRWAGLHGDALFDSLLVFENYPVSEALQQGGVLGGLHFGKVANHEQTNYPLTLVVGLGETLSIRYSHDWAQLGGEIVQQIAGHFGNLLEELIRDAKTALGELPSLSPEEHQRIVYDWNRTEASYPSEQCVHELIEAQVERSPDGVALVFGDRSLTYGELNRRANRLAHRLREQGVGPDVLVGIAVERSLEMVVGLLGVLKSGGAYVPLDPDYPEDRLAYMVEDSGIELLLTQREVVERLPSLGGLQSVCLEGGEDWLEGYSEANLDHRAGPENLAYVIYTSGSTGRPKGAANTHKALVNRLWWMQKAYELDAADTVLQKTPFSFDVSVWEFFWPLLSGARLAVAYPEEHRDPDRLIDRINRHEVTTLHFVPSMLQAFISSERAGSCLSIRRLVCSGEVLPIEFVRKFQNELPAASLFNLYGPTEAAIDVTHWTCSRDGNGVPIGEPIDNLKTHVLEMGLQPAVQGGTGELYLGGGGLARGYHARPGLTAERFLPDPFDEHGGGRLYRTGDLARYRADGVIEYVGRIDHQVKVRGFRIELGEIEARLLEQVAVREAVVLAQEGASGKQLVGYVVPAEAEVMESHEAQSAQREVLRAALRASLPEYMVPAHLLFLECLPLTPNGKLDRKALPQPDASLLQSSYVAPRTELERQIAAIWAEVLKVERVGLDDNFFELGGHSLLATQATARIQTELNVDLSLDLLFRTKTLQAYAVRVENSQSSSEADFDDLRDFMTELEEV